MTQYAYSPTYGHTPLHKALAGDVYGIGYDPERASRRSIRLGIIGAGGVAQSKYLPAIARLRMIWEPVELVAFATRNKEQARKIETTYHTRHYSDYQQMLAQEEIDGVLVLSPDQLHPEHTIAALESGRHVLVEKPIARSLIQAESMCRTAERLGPKLMAVANKRYSPPYRRAKLLIEAGILSDPAMFVGKFNLGYDYVDLFESGTIHLFDLTRYLMGDVQTVFCTGINRYSVSHRRYPVDNAIAVFNFVSGAVGSLYTSASALSFKPWERVEVYGKHAWLAVEDQRDLIVYRSEEGPEERWSPVLPNTLLFDEEFGGFMGMLENFAQVIRGKEAPLVTGWDGYRAYELNVACHLSLARKAQVSLPLDPSNADAEALAWLKSSGWPGKGQE
jgi:predicted dehydrogenase